MLQCTVHRTLQSLGAKVRAGVEAAAWKKQHLAPSSQDTSIIVLLLHSESSRPECGESRSPVLDTLLDFYIALFRLPVRACSGVLDARPHETTASPAACPRMASTVGIKRKCAARPATVMAMFPELAQEAFVQADPYQAPPTMPFRRSNAKKSVFLRCARREPEGSQLRLNAANKQNPFACVVPSLLPSRGPANRQQECLYPSRLCLHMSGCKTQFGHRLGRNVRPLGFDQKAAECREQRKAGEGLTIPRTRSLQASREASGLWLRSGIQAVGMCFFTAWNLHSARNRNPSQLSPARPRSAVMLFVELGSHEDG